MQINTKKTKITCILHQENHKVKISIDDQQVEQIGHVRHSEKM